MKKQLDNTVLWNEAAKAGLLLGAVSIGCLLLKEWTAVAAGQFWQQAAGIVLWAVEFFGCILLMKKVMLSLRDRYQDVRMADTYKLGRRTALLSGLLLASAQALILLKMPQGEMATMLDQAVQTMKLSSADRDTLDSMVDRMPLLTFIFQWLYCYLYGTILSSILSRYIFLQKLFGGMDPFNTPDDNTPDNQ